MQKQNPTHVTVFRQQADAMEHDIISHMNISDALAELGILLGIGPLALNDEGAARVTFDGSLDVDFLTDLNDASLLHLHATLGVLPPDVSAQTMRELLEAHFLGLGTGGGVFSINPTETDIIFSRPLAMPAMQFSEFSGAVESFVNFSGRLEKTHGRGRLSLSPINKRRLMTQEQLLQELGARLGIGALNFDNGICRLVFDGTLSVNLEEGSHERELYFYSSVGSLGSEAEGAETLKELLKANHLGMDVNPPAALALLPSEADGYLCAVIQTAGLDAADLAAMLGRFVREVKRWTLRAAEFGRDVGQADDPGAADLSEFIRV